ncbi:hypothetical protein JVT61DRAFT_3739 [Boletus reticuloceps]|uniref:Uncharacterized protein n=1 Tax=Boletus reticuloceps TaxID=495285 RepID=A0A8I2YN90_9AGAM|nr:hypothetical protein JVT61DRAFT_3739 [Boletus reticuloceps]
MGFKTAILFTAVRFQAAVAVFFLNALFFSHFVEGFSVREAMPKALLNGFDLGSHSDVVLFELPLSPSQNPAVSVTIGLMVSHFRSFAPPVTQSALGGSSLLFPAGGRQRAAIQPVGCGKMDPESNR